MVFPCAQRGSEEGVKETLTRVGVCVWHVCVRVHVACVCTCACVCAHVHICAPCWLLRLLRLAGVAGACPGFPGSPFCMVGPHHALGARRPGPFSPLAPLGPLATRVNDDDPWIPEMVETVCTGAAALSHFLRSLPQTQPTWRACGQETSPGYWLRNSKAWCPWSGRGVVGSLARVGHLHEQTEQINLRWPAPLILAAPTSTLPHARLPRDVAQRGGRVQWAGLGGQPASGARESPRSCHLLR